MHFVDEHVPKKQIARRLGVDIKTVRRALERDEAPSARHSPPRGRRLDPWRTAIEAWLKEEPRLSAKRIGRLLEPEAGRVPERTVREYVASVRGTLFPREAFVHRTHRAGDTMEGDFFDTAAVVAGELCRLKVFVGTLPASNVYFAKAYRVERRECLMDGTHESFVFFGGVPRRVVYDNTSLAVKRVLPGRERAEADAFHAFRGGYPFHADYCAPARGNEKGSVEAGVRYVRGLFFRPRPEYESLEQLNAALRAELEVDLDRRQLRDGRTAREAWLAEREHLRPLPPRPPERCRIEARTADKFGHVRVDRAIYSVPIAFAYKAVWAKVYPDRIDLAVDDAVVARPLLRRRRLRARSAPRPAAARKKAPRRVGGDRAARLGVARGLRAAARRAGPAHAQARPRVGAGAAPDRGLPARRARGRGRGGACCRHAAARERALPAAPRRRRRRRAARAAGAPRPSAGRGRAAGPRRLRPRVEG
jgi:transposase